MTTRLPINQIRVGHRVRKDLGDLKGLAQSIEAVGLLHPIVPSIRAMGCSRADHRPLRSQLPGLQRNAPGLLREMTIKSNRSRPGAYPFSSPGTPDSTPSRAARIALPFGSQFEAALRALSPVAHSSGFRLSFQGAAKKVSSLTKFLAFDDSLCLCNLCRGDRVNF